MNTRIEVGDIVKVRFMAQQVTLLERAEVVYWPCSPGDTMVFRDTENNDIHYVFEPCTVTLLQKQNHGYY